MTSYKTKQKGVWRHSIANKIRLKWKKEWNRRALSKSNIKRDKRKRKNYHGRRFNFALTWYLCEAYKRKKTNKVKFRLCSFRLNFLFKNILQNILHMKKTGTIFVRFLQPVRLLISLKKLRKITRNNWVISRYRKQRLYKRLLPYIALLFRYWGFQPLLEQIAFEMEKTKKHWPLLRTIRVLILLLKPKFYTGYRIAVRGKISSSKRTRLFSIRCGKLPISTFQNRMTYSFYQSNARIGSFGIKSWSYFRA